MEFRSGSIYHVKIAQRNLLCSDPTLDYFPFDNVYIVHRKDEHLVHRMFRYYLVMNYSDVIAKMLEHLWVEQEKTIRVHRDDIAFEGQTVEDKNQFKISNSDDWLLVVPTHVNPRRRAGSKIPTFAEIGYLMSSVITSSHNLGINLPSIALQTPDIEIPLLCSICANLPNYYDGKCLPGTLTCRNNAKTKLPLDLDREHSFNKSAEEVVAT